MEQSLLVMKFGGTSVGSVETIALAARHVEREVKSGMRVIVVVSAMGSSTDSLVKLGKEISNSGRDENSRVEFDALLATGEAASAAVMAMQLQRHGLRAKSWAGWQIPIITDAIHGNATIVDIGTDAIGQSLARGEIAVVTGFQGINSVGRVTTLGRGGSDISAVALAGAFGATRCDIYTDVRGVYTADPRVVEGASLLEKIAFAEILELASLGTKVIHTRAVRAAMVQDVCVLIRSTFDDPEAPQDIEKLGTSLCKEADMTIENMVTGIACMSDEAKVTVFGVPDEPGIAGVLFSVLAEAHIVVDMIAQTISAEGSDNDMTFTVPRVDLQHCLSVLGDNQEMIRFSSLSGSGDIVKISVVGLGMISSSGVAARTFTTLAEVGVNIQSISTSELKMSVIIDRDYAEIAVRALHKAFELDQAVAIEAD